MLEDIVAEIINVALSGLFVAAATFVVLILKRLATRFGLQIDAIQEARLKSAVQDVLLGVEEEVEAKVKAEVIPSVNKGVAKLELAVERIADTIPGITTEEAQQLVQQELPKIGLGAAGFVTEVVKRAGN